MIFLHSVAPYALIKPGKQHLEISPKDFGFQNMKVTLNVEKNVDLVGYIIAPKTDSIRGLMILVHGIGGCKEHFVPLGAKLASKGIISVVFDERAHGESGGDYCTYGYYEKNDISKIVDYIKQEYPPMPIGIWGNSLGGAVALQALEVDKRLSFGIIESTFTNLHQIAFDYKKRYLQGIGIRFISDYVVDRAAEIADFDPYKITPIKSVENIEQSMFIAHGDIDERISIEYGKALFDNLKTKDKTWYTIEGGTHMNLSKKGGQTYQKALLNFIDTNLKK